jgi:peptidoglycan/xylan/chitin deacetylase (PgdA/CDA1 family)
MSNVIPRKSSVLALTLLLVVTKPVFGIAQVIKSGPASCPGVALTFDLCPVRGGSGYDQALIDYLIEHQIPATFFLSGKWIAKHDEQVKTLLQTPFFELGTHGDIHAHLPLHTAEEQKQEILGPVRLVKAKYGQQTSLFRPPYGEYNDETVQMVNALGLKFILWNVVSGDPDPTLSATQIEDRLAKRTRNGSIIVMHANGRGKHTREVVEHLYEHLLPQRHLKPMTVSDVLACQPPTP